MITVACNKHSQRLSPALKKFYDRCRYINEKESRPFSYMDFDMKQTSFRQNVLRLKADIEVVYRTTQAFYKIKGIELPGDSHRVTFRDTGDVSNLIQILEALEDQPAKIHDVKIMLDADIHSALVKDGCTVNLHNHGIQIKCIPITDSNIVVKASVYPQTVQLDVACTYKPIIYDVDSLLYFTEMLKEASMYLATITHAVLPPVKDWIITHYHLNKDGTFELNGESFHFTISDVTSGLIRFYSKKMKDGKVFPRIEQIETPKITIAEAMKKAMGNTNRTFNGQVCSKTAGSRRENG